MTDPPFRCADASEEREEPLVGTASFVARWLLVEQPGPWGSDALMESRLPVEAGAELRRRARRAGVRVVLIRRGAGFAIGNRQCYLARTDGGEPYLSRLEVTRIDDLLDVDLGAFAYGEELAGSVPHPDPLFLVCTHGRHDACCSIRGNQVSRVACAKPGADSWECSHIGGDRFAANVVCFPHGIYYGRVGPDEVAELIDLYTEGLVSLDHLRGRCSYPFPVQAAEHFARRATGILEVDDLGLVAHGSHDGDVTATFGAADGRKVDVRVRVRSGPGPHRLTCGSTNRGVIPVYEPVSCVIA